MLPFELVATATDSPRNSPAGSLRKFGTAVNGISGTPVIVAFCWADAEPARSRTAAHVQARCRVMGRSLHHRTQPFNHDPLILLSASREAGGRIERSRPPGLQPHSSTPCRKEPRLLCAAHPACS